MSSFFPKEDVSTLDDRLNAAMNRIIHSATNPCLVEFPDVSNVLWCGEAVDNPFYLKASDCLPKLFLGLPDIHALLNQVQGNNVEVTNSLNAVDVFHGSSFEQVSERDSGKYFFALPDINRSCASRSVVSLPLTNDVESTGEGSFDRQSTIALIRNLIKSLQYGKEFSLKSCYRLRAIGHAHNGYSQHNMHDVHGKLTFEAVCPNVTFRATPIRTLPIVPSPLFHELTRSNPRQQSPKMGYLTLNQSRKLVPMMENDPSVSSTPLVGVWVRFGHLSSDDMNDNCNLLKHPFSWGACVRYLCHEAIRDRRFADQETFVVVVIVAGVELEFYEVCRMVDILEGVQHNVSPLSLRVEDFVVSDLAVDLSTHLGMTGEEFVIGQFRPQTSSTIRSRPYYLNEGVRASRDFSHQSAGKQHTNHYHAARTSAGLSSSVLFEGETITPAPRNTLPTPLPLKYPASSSSGVREGIPSVRVSADFSFRRSTDRLPVNREAADIISAQQRQIDLLTMEVQRLSQLIERNPSKRSEEVTTRVAVDRSVDAPSVLAVPQSIPSLVSDVPTPALEASIQSRASQEGVSVASSTAAAPPAVKPSYLVKKEEDSFLTNVSECSELPSRRSGAFVSMDRLSSFGGHSSSSSSSDALRSSYSRNTTSHIRPESDSILAICAKYGKY